MARKNNYRFTFTFDKDYVGHASYHGTLKQCVKFFNKDQQKHKIPLVKTVINVENVDK